MANNQVNFLAKTSRFYMVTDVNDNYKMMTMMMMMIRMMKIQNGHNSANFEARTSRFDKVIDLNDTFRMMMTKMIMMLMIRMMMKTQNSNNSTNFDDISPRFCLLIEINDTYRLYFQVKSQVYFAKKNVLHIQLTSFICLSILFMCNFYLFLHLCIVQMCYHAKFLLSSLKIE